MCDLILSFSYHVGLVVVCVYNIIYQLFFYRVDLNLLDWSSQNLLAVCLGGNVYLWNATSGDITQLMEMEGPEDYISSVSFIKEGHNLAIGTSTGEVQVGVFLVVRLKRFEKYPIRN